MIFSNAENLRKLDELDRDKQDLQAEQSGTDIRSTKQTNTNSAAKLKNSLNEAEREYDAMLQRL